MTSLRIIIENIRKSLHLNIINIYGIILRLEIIYDLGGVILTTLLYAVIGVLTVIAVLLLFSRNKILREKRESERKLKDTLSDLENVYSEINTTQEELNVKYREIKANEDKIRKLAYEDSLTGLPNSVAFNEMLTHTLETLRKEESVGIMYVDLDNFKQVDDLWGHANCDELILDVSHRLRQNLDENDYLAKMSGDEFMILSQNILESTEFNEKLKRIGNSFRFPFITSFGQVVVTTSIGATLAPRDGTKADVLIKNATTALSEAKRLGKDNYCYYSEEMNIKGLENLELQSSLTNAIKNESLIIKYAPVYNIDDRSYDTVRMRLLWDRGEKGIWQARRFISFAEKTGQILALGENTFRKVCEEMKIFTEKKVILPLSKRLVLNYDFRNKLYGIVAETDTDIGRMIIEIDENILVSDMAESSFVIEEMLAKGFGFRVGRYGSGGMSMDILKNLPVSQVSIPVNRLLEENETEDVIKYLKIVTSVVNELGENVSFSGISDSIGEDVVRKCGGKLVEGELYGPLLSAEEIR